MAKFRKKPVVIEAFKFDRPWSQDLTVPAWAVKAAAEGIIDFDSEQYGAILIKTLEGTMRATASDWIIRGVNGEIYPCKPDIFEKTYESVE